eukprot:6660030-Alexandrium_andersonii.AAC.1
MSEAHRLLFSQQNHFAQVHLMLGNVTALKAGRGCASIPAVTGHTSALLMRREGPHGPFHFEELRSATTRSPHLGGISLWDAHPD